MFLFQSTDVNVLKNKSLDFAHDLFDGQSNGLWMTG